MRVKTGDIYYVVRIDDDGAVSLEEYVVSSVQTGHAHLIHKTPWTWVKRSTTAGDYGWAKNIDPCWRAKFRLEYGPPSDWARTKAAAYGKALPAIEQAIKRLTKLRGTLLAQQTRAKGKRPSPSPQVKTDD